MRFKEVTYSFLSLAVFSFCLFHVGDSKASEYIRFGLQIDPQNVELLVLSAFVTNSVEEKQILFQKARKNCLYYIDHCQGIFSLSVYIIHHSLGIDSFRFLLYYH
jgi:hypothetical protein